KGLYELTGDKLVLLFFQDGKTRPGALTPRTRLGENLLVLKREKPAKLTDLDWATLLVKNLRLENTSYRHKPTTVKWKGIDGAADYESHTDCSGFLNALLKRAHGLTDDSLEEWLGTKRPLAKTYHDAITGQKKFRRILLVKDVQPGDIIAIKYRPGDPENIDNNSGH